MTAHVLYGDGVHDDTAAIQELLDSGCSCVTLPPPKAHYLISKTLRLHSFQELKLDRWTQVKLAPASNCPMLTNDDHVHGNRNIAITGGIWDANNIEQAPNPQMLVEPADLPGSDSRARRMVVPENQPADPTTGTPLPWKKIKNLPYHPDRYYGIGMRFVNVDGFEMSSLTMRNPVMFAIQCGKLRNFTFKHIVFDFNEGHPSPDNMDGLHFDGFCRNGYIADIKGACYDDLLAFNAEDDYPDSPGFGPIENIVVDGIFADRCHSAARLLSCGSEVRNITIRNVRGSFYRYAIGLTHYFPQRPARGRFDGLVFENLHMCKALPLPSDWNPCRDYAMIWAEGCGSIGTLKVTGFHRLEETTGTPSIEIDKAVEIDSLILDDISVENRLPETMDLLHHEGTINSLRLGAHRLIGDVRVIRGEGTIGSKTLF